MRKLLTALVLVLATAAGVQAQGWPDKPVTLLVPFPPGGSTDLIARTLSPKLPHSSSKTNPAQAARLALSPPSARHPTATRSSSRRSGPS